MGGAALGLGGVGLLFRLLVESLQHLANTFRGHPSLDGDGSQGHALLASFEDEFFECRLASRVLVGLPPDLDSHVVHAPHRCSLITFKPVDTLCVNSVDTFQYEAHTESVNSVDDMKGAAMTEYKPAEQFDITYDRDPERRHSWHISRDGAVIGRVWLAGQNQWTSGDKWVYRSRIAAAMALAGDTPMEG